MKKTCLILTFLLSSLFWVTSCSKSTVENQKNGILTVSNVDLFKGDAKKFQPFLGAHAGDIHVTYEGKKNKLKTSWEIWENGVKTDSSESLTINLTPHDQQKKYDGDFIISVNETNLLEKSANPVYLITTALVDDTGSASGSFKLEKKKNLSIQSILQLQKPISIDDTKSILVWGFQGTNEKNLSNYPDIEENLRHVEWAFVFRISVAE